MMGEIPEMGQEVLEAPLLQEYDIMKIFPIKEVNFNEFLCLLEKEFCWSMNHFYILKKKKLSGIIFYYCRRNLKTNCIGYFVTHFYCKAKYEK